MGSAFDNVSPILKEQAFQGTRVYATSAKPPLQQGATLTLTTPVTSGFQHKGEGVEKKTEEQVDKELAGYDYWGIKRKNLVKADGTPWVWNSFTPTDAYQADVNVDLNKHWPVSGPADWVALKTVRFLRFWADLLFQKRWGCRAVMLETVAAVPGMVAGALLHCKSLRRMEHSGGWIKALLEEAENERMHLMTFVEITKPRLWERALVFTVQGIFFNAYFVAYIVWPKVCHRIVGYLEEEAVISYTHFLEAIDSGKIENTAAPAIAIDYWKLPKDATLRDVVIAVRADEAHHRDVNHFAANIKTQGKELKESPAPLGYH
jgi:ubiquinol oxidase